jgi:hypothetical protein
MPGELAAQSSVRTLLIDASYGPLVESSPMGDVDCGALLETLVLVGRAVNDIDTVPTTLLAPPPRW